MIPTLAAVFLLAATPAPDPAAVVASLNGKPILRREAADGRALLGRILGELLEDFAKRRRVEATPAEVTKHVRLMDEMERTRDERHLRELEKLRAALAKAANEYQKTTIAANIESLEKTHAELQKLKPFMEKYRPSETARREMARTTIRGYKMNQALWAAYGGRVAFQQFGPEPVDAYRKLLEEHEKKGTFTIVDQSMVAPFWNYVRNDAVHMFIEGPDAAKMMTTSWWLQPPPD